MYKHVSQGLLFGRPRKYFEIEKVGFKTIFRWVDIAFRLGYFRFFILIGKHFATFEMIRNTWGKTEKGRSFAEISKVFKVKFW